MTVIPIVPLASRSCGECQACCNGWLKATVGDQELRPGSPCRHLVKEGCGIYETRPEHPCRTFFCGWRVNDQLFPDEYRPDRIGVIVLRFTWRGRYFWVLTSAGSAPDEAMRLRMRQHSDATGEPHVLYSPGRLLCYGPPEFRQEMIDLSARGEAPW